MTATLPLLFAGALALAPAFAAGTSVLTDPGIPSGEKCVYTAACDTSTDIRAEVTTIRTVDGVPVYEILSKSVHEDKTIILDRATLALRSSQTVKRGREATVTMAWNISDVRTSPAPDEVRAADFSSIRYVLRGFPFGRLNLLRVNALNGNNDFTMKVKYIGTEPMELMGKTVSCHKLEMSLGGIFSAFFPKMSLWYLAAPPHYLVCYDGPAENNRKAKCQIKLVRYEIDE